MRTDARGVAFHIYSGRLSKVKNLVRALVVKPMSVNMVRFAPGMPWVNVLGP